ncbi:DUF5133 domain-containing protein [Streptomyces sp. NPDC003247]|uniref:DUF5133 domain-containing protein n=1 Tax=Streptomyces sp. NPDC003247 TaxID=3364677 RepID=UPI0036C920B6
MIVPDPKAVRTLLTRYASLKIAQAERESPQTARELEDVTYTLCVLMGTSDVREAVAAADALLVSAVGSPPAARVPRQEPDQGKSQGRDPERDGESGLSLAV